MSADQITALQVGIDSSDTRYGKRERMAPHYHDEACLVLTLSGSVRHTEGGREMVLFPRSLLYLPPAERHEDVFGFQGARCVVIRINQEWTRRRFGCDFGGLSPRVTKDSHLYALGITVHRELEKPDDLSCLIVEGALLELLGRWKRERILQGKQPPTWLERVKIMLMDCFRTPVTLRDVSRTAGVHPARVAREFRRAYGTTTGAYVRKLRVDWVARRLAAAGTREETCLVDLALDAGFSSHAHMAFAFKQLTGLTPSEFSRVHTTKSTG